MQKLQGDLVISSAQLLCTNDRGQGFSYKGTTIHRIVKGVYPTGILIFFKLIVGAIIVLFFHCHSHTTALVMKVSLSREGSKNQPSNVMLQMISDLKNSIKNELCMQT